jgi:hypothetical protein
VIYTTIPNCRVCSSTDLVQVLAFAPQYLGSIFTADNSQEPLAREKVPLTLMLCKGCSTVQLKETVDPTYLYTKYFYRSNTNVTTQRDLHEVVQHAERLVSLCAGDVVLDIGCNDGTLLHAYPENLRRIGIDPARNIAWPDDIEVINDYFSLTTVKERVGEQKVKVITCCACLYDMPDPSQVVRNIAALLDKDCGFCIIQVSYLLATIRDYNYYDICHEHLFYFSLQTLNNLLESNGLHIFDCETSNINGGTIRVYAWHGAGRGHRFFTNLSLEEKYKLASVDTFKQFGARIQEDTRKIHDFISEAKTKGQLVLGLGGSTKGNVLLQLCDLDSSLIPAISDRNALKVGLRTIGTDIPIISEADARGMKPDYFFCPIWNFKHEVLAREAEYIAGGGKILFAMPYPYVLDKDGEHKL